MCDDKQAQMPEGSEFHTERQQHWNRGKQRLCVPKELTTDWCWRSMENMQGCGSSEESGGK